MLNTLELISTYATGVDVWAACLGCNSYEARTTVVKEYAVGSHSA